MRPTDKRKALVLSSPDKTVFSLLQRAQANNELCQGYAIERVSVFIHVYVCLSTYDDDCAI